MKMFKTLVSFENEGGTIWQVDTIEHEGMLWLVPSWNESPLEGLSMPARIVCISNLKHQKMGDFGEIDFLLNDPLPRPVFDGTALKQIASRFLVVEAPDIKIRIPRGIH